MKRFNFRLHRGTRHSVERKGSRCSIGPIPGAVKAWRGTQRAASRDGPVVRDIGDGDSAAALGVAPVPELGDGLPVGEREREAPAVDRRGAGVGDSQTGAKAPLPLVGDRIMHATSCSCGRVGLPSACCPVELLLGSAASLLASVSPRFLVRKPPSSANRARWSRWRTNPMSR